MGKVKLKLASFSRMFFFSEQFTVRGVSKTLAIIENGVLLQYVRSFILNVSGISGTPLTGVM